MPISLRRTMEEFKTATPANVLADDPELQRRDTDYLGRANTGGYFHTMGEEGRGKREKPEDKPASK